MLAVVVLPCVPVTAMVGRRRVSSPSRSARCSSRSPRSRAAARSGFSGGIADDTTSSAPAGTLAASWATSARPLIPAPPMPTKCSLRPAQGFTACKRRRAARAGHADVTVGTGLDRVTRARPERAVAAGTTGAGCPDLTGPPIVCRPERTESMSRSAVRKVPLLAAVSALFALGACGGSDDQEGTSGTPAQSGAAPANVTEKLFQGSAADNRSNPSEGGKKGGKLTMLSGGDVDYMDPGKTYYSYAIGIMNAIHRGLYAHLPGDTSKPVPDLADG